MDRLNKIIENYPVELKMLFVCCGSERWNVEDLLPARTLHPKGASAHKAIDWDLFYQWMRRHRVAPAVYRYIKKNPAVLPEVVVKRVEERYREVVLRNIMLLAETIKVSNLLNSASVINLPFKGISLSFQLYGNINGREIRDIDILIEKRDIIKSVELLINNGFILLQNIKNKEKLFKEFYPVVLKHKELPYTIELHRRLLPWEGLGNELIPTFFRNSIKINTEGYAISAPPAAEHAEFAIYHGTKHLWSGLQWLNDLEHAYKVTGSSNSFCPHAIDLAVSLYNYLYGKKTDSGNNKFYGWKKICLKSIGVFKESELKKLFYKIQYFRMAVWMNKNRKRFMIEYLMEFFFR